MKSMLFIAAGITVLLLAVGAVDALPPDGTCQEMFEILILAVFGGVALWLGVKGANR